MDLSQMGDDLINSAQEPQPATTPVAPAPVAPAPPQPIARGVRGYVPQPSQPLTPPAAAPVPVPGQQDLGARGDDLITSASGPAPAAAAAPAPIKPKKLRAEDFGESGWFADADNATADWLQNSWFGRLMNPKAQEVAVDAATFGSAKYAAAGGSWLHHAIGNVIRGRDAVTGTDENGLTPGQAYDNAADLSRQMQAEYMKEHPYAGTALKVLGSFAGMNPEATGASLLRQAAPATTAAKVGQFLKTGAKSGMVGGAAGFTQGFNDAEGDFWTHLGGGIAGGITGMAIGAVLPAGLSVLGGLWRAGKYVTGAGDASKNVAGWVEQRIQQALQDDGHSPAAAAQLMQQWKASGGKAFTLMDVAGDAMMRLARSVYTAGGEGGSKLRAFLDERSNQLTKRINTHLENTLIPQRNIYDVAGELRTQREEQGGPYFKDAFKNNQQVESPEINGILNTPAGQDALSRAITRMRNRLQLVSKPDPELTAALNEAIALGKVPPEARTGVGVGKGLKLQTLHYVKMGLDDMTRAARIDPHWETVNGRGLGSYGDLAGLTKKFRNALIDADATGSYAKGLKEWSGPSQSLDALDMGRDFTKLDPEQIRMQMAKLGDGDKEHYRLGATRRIQDMMGGATGPLGFLKAFGGGSRGELLRDQVRALFDNDADFQSFTQLMQHEAKMQQLSQEVTKGTQTTNKAADSLKEHQDHVGELVGLATDTAMTGMSKWPAIKYMLGKGMGMAKTAIAGMTPQRAEAIQKILTKANPDEISQIMREWQMRDVHRRIAAAQKLKSAPAKGAAAAAIVSKPAAAILAPQNPDQQALPQYARGGRLSKIRIPEFADGGRTKELTAAAFHEVYHNTPKIVRKTAKKEGRAQANKQRVAIALSKARRAGARIPYADGGAVPLPDQVGMTPDSPMGPTPEAQTALGAPNVESPPGYAEALAAGLPPTTRLNPRSWPADVKQAVTEADPAYRWASKTLSPSYQLQRLADYGKWASDYQQQHSDLIKQGKTAEADALFQKHLNEDPMAQIAFGMGTGIEEAGGIGGGLLHEQAANAGVVRGQPHNASYITPEGHFIGSNEIGQGHEDIAEKLGFSSPDDLVHKTGAIKINAGQVMEGDVQIGTTRPTPAQMTALGQHLKTYAKPVDAHVEYKGILGQGISTPRDIVKHMDAVDAGTDVNVKAAEKMPPGEFEKGMKEAQAKYPLQPDPNRPWWAQPGTYSEDLDLTTDPWQQITQRAHPDHPGFEAYHGSGAKFEKFSTDMALTGEGNNSEGHGIYLAKSPEVGQSYRDTVGGVDDMKLRVAGKTYPRNPAGPLTPEQEAADYVMSFAGHDTVGPHGGETRTAAKALKAAISNFFYKGGELVKGQFENDTQKVLAVLQDWDSKGGIKMTVKPGGSFYKVHVGADPERFIDEGKLLSEQHPDVKRAFAEHGITPDNMDEDGKPHTGGSAYDALAQKMGGGNAERGQQDASQILAAQGIPGLRYLDEYSRHNRAPEILQPQLDKYKARLADPNIPEYLRDGLQQRHDDLAEELDKAQNPTHNYVVFDDKLLNIKEAQHGAGKMKPVKPPAAPTQTEAVYAKSGMGANRSQFEVLKNPTQKEAEDLARQDPGGGVRFMRTKDGSVYMWSADRGTHEDVWNSLGTEIPPASERGTFQLVGGKLEFEDMPKNQPIDRYKGFFRAATPAERLARHDNWVEPQKPAQPAPQPTPTSGTLAERARQAGMLTEDPQIAGYIDAEGNLIGGGKAGHGNHDEQAEELGFKDREDLIDKTGAIRINGAWGTEGPIGDLQIGRRPTKEQMAALRDFIKQGDGSSFNAEYKGKMANDLTTPRDLVRHMDNVDADEQKPAAPGKVAASNVGKEALAKAQFRSVSLDKATALAKKGVHLKQDPKTGQYIGAPRGMDAPAKLNAMRRNYDRLVDMGVPGRLWYERVQGANRELTGNDPAKMDLLSSEFGLFSPQATPETNMQFLLQAHNAYEAGRPLPKVRTGLQAKTYNEARAAGTLPKLGKKTDIFAQHTNPNLENPAIAANDIWEARNMGFTNAQGKPFDRALTAQEHTFMDGEHLLAADRANQKKIGGYTDWTPGKMQAASWVGGRSEAYMKNGMPLEKAQKRAMSDFADYLDKHTANATHEAIPGIGTGHLPGLVGGPEAARAAYSFDPRSTWATAPGGRDAIYNALGMYTRPTEQATGYFTGKSGTPESNPSFVARPLVDFAKGPMGNEISPASAGMMDAAEAVRAYMDAQSMGAWHKMIASGKASAAGSATIAMNRALTHPEITALAKLGEKYNLLPIDTGHGVNLLDFGNGPGGTKMNKLLRGDLGKEIREILPDAGEAQRMRMASNAIDYEDAMAAANEGKGLATKILMNRLTQDPRTSGLLEKLDNSLEIRKAARDRLARDAELAKNAGDPIRKDIQNARSIIMKKGFSGLFEALKKGGEYLPALIGGAGALGAGAAGAGFGAPQQQPQS